MRYEEDTSLFLWGVLFGVFVGGSVISSTLCFISFSIILVYNAPFPESIARYTGLTHPLSFVKRWRHPIYLYIGDPVEDFSDTDIYVSGHVSGLCHPPREYISYFDAKTTISSLSGKMLTRWYNLVDISEINRWTRTYVVVNIHEMPRIKIVPDIIFCPRGTDMSIYPTYNRVI